VNDLVDTVPVYRPVRVVYRVEGKLRRCIRRHRVDVGFAVQDVVRRDREQAFAVEVFEGLVEEEEDGTLVLDEDPEEVDRVDRSNHRVEDRFARVVFAFEDLLEEGIVAEPVVLVCNFYRRMQAHRFDVHRHNQLDRVEGRLDDWGRLEVDRRDLEEPEVVDRGTSGKAQDVPCRKTETRVSLQKEDE
jgi:hypothetical protein